MSRPRRLLSGLFTLALVALVVFLWPAGLGGSTRLVIVSGHSMEPTYSFGDIVIARDGSRPQVGDTVVFEVPEGTAEGMLVIHRIIGVDDDGFFVTQGDNRDTPDQWQLTDDNIVGHPWLAVPKGGHAVWFLRQWSILAILIGLLTVVLLWPSRAAPERIDVDTDDDAGGDDAGGDDAGGDDAGGDDAGGDAPPAGVAGGLSDDVSWPGRPIEVDMIAEANAWLDEQVGAALRDSADPDPLERRVRPGRPTGAVVAETEVQRIRARVLQAVR